uniref:DOMON domain-containing protein n=1 Tax=Steinernema glaseri TaxID=37863 RepID=A0A1I7YWK5_9BILA
MSNRYLNENERCGFISYETCFDILSDEDQCLTISGLGWITHNWSNIATLLVDQGDAGLDGVVVYEKEDGSV